VGIYLVLFDLAFVFLYPFITMIIDAFKSEEDLINSTVTWIPTSLYWQNFQTAFKQLDYVDFFKNSAIVTIVATIGHVISCSFIGYGFARYRFKGKSILFGGVILSMLVPTQVIIFPLYMNYSTWGWIDTYLPLCVPAFLGFGLRGGFYIFLFRQFMMSLPYEMEEAAKIDGCGPLKTFIKIILPMSRSSILVCSVLSIVWHWNDYFEPRIYLNSYKLAMLPSKLEPLYEALNRISSESDDASTSGTVIVNQAMCMAATFLVILPLLIAYTFVQKKFMEGVERSGLTGM
jgi:multiple sugar transport system permease protein